MCRSLKSLHGTSFLHRPVSCTYLPANLLVSCLPSAPFFLEAELTFCLLYSSTCVCLIFFKCVVPECQDSCLIYLDAHKGPGSFSSVQKRSPPLCIQVSQEHNLNPRLPLTSGHEDDYLLCNSQETAGSAPEEVLPHAVLGYTQGRNCRVRKNSQGR